MRQAHDKPSRPPEARRRDGNPRNHEGSGTRETAHGEAADRDVLREKK
jgi:hypothetical protein